MLVQEGLHKKSVPQLFRKKDQTPRMEHTYLLESREPGSGDSGTESYHLDTLTSKASIPIKLHFSLNGAKTTMELDTGPSSWITSESTYWRLCKANPPIIKHSFISIQTYVGERVKILGKIQVHIVYKKEKIQGTLLIKIDGFSLIGWEWLGKMLLDWIKMTTTHRQPQELIRFSEKGCCLPAWVWNAEGYDCFIAHWSKGSTKVIQT